MSGILEDCNATKNWTDLLILSLCGNQVCKLTEQQLMPNGGWYNTKFCMQFDQKQKKKSQD